MENIKAWNYIVGIAMALLGFFSKMIIDYYKGQSENKLADNDEVQKLIDGYIQQLEEQRKITDQYKERLEDLEARLKQQNQSFYRREQQLEEKLSKVLAQEEIYRKNIENLRSRYHRIANEVRLLEISSPQMQVPAWIKDAGGVMLKLNDAYEEQYLKPIKKVRSDYIGKTDEEFWDEVIPGGEGEKIGKGYRNGDMAAIEKGKPTAHIESMVTEEGIGEVYSIKYPMVIPGFEGDNTFLAGIAGHTIDKDLIHSLMYQINNR